MGIAEKAVEAEKYYRYGERSTVGSRGSKGCSSSFRERRVIVRLGLVALVLCVYNSCKYLVGTYVIGCVHYLPSLA